MAKKKTPLPAVQSTPECHCGECSHAETFCCPDPGGRPIFCRCSLKGGPLRFLSEKACGEHFEQRNEPVPEKIPNRRLDMDKTSGDVVPVFGDDPRVPVGYVPSEGLPIAATTTQEIDRRWREMSGESDRENL